MPLLCTVIFALSLFSQHRDFFKGRMNPFVSPLKQDVIIKHDFRVSLKSELKITATAQRRGRMLWWLISAEVSTEDYDRGKKWGKW